MNTLNSESLNHAYDMPNYDNNPNSFMQNHSLNIASLNCRSLTKPSTPEIRADFIRYLRSLQLDILCVQESHAIEEFQNQLNMRFQASHTIWTQHCGKISFNPSIILHSLDIDLDQRLIVCQVAHANSLFAPFSLINVYAPAQFRPRVQFFRTLLNMPLFRFSASDNRASLSTLTTPLDSDPASTHPMLFMGDFNYHATIYITDNSVSSIHDTNITNNGAALHRHLHSILNSQFFECTHSREEGPLLPTFRCGSTQSAIDYLYASPFLFQYLHSSEIAFLASTWTDHALLRARFVFPSDRQDPGM